MIHQGLLRYGGGRYFWVALLLVVASVLLFIAQNRAIGANGGTWQGYVLGTAAALLVVWLALLGIRKRRYRSGMGTVQGWSSAHVYLGTAVVVIATLHCAAQFHWNVHTLTYVLLCIVVLSGLTGLFAYMTSPRALSETRAGRSRASMFSELFDLDAEGRQLARKCDPAVGLAVKSAIERTVIGGGVLAQLFGRDRSLWLTGEHAGAAPALARNTDQQPIIEFVATRVPRATRRTEAADLQSLVALLCRRQALLRRIRRDIRLQGWLKAWLFVHVPLTFALLIALAIHIVTTFIYW